MKEKALDMIVSHKYKFIFIKTAKTAGTSLEVYLSQFCSENDILTPINPPVFPHVARNYKGIWNPVPEIISSRGENIASVIWYFLKRQKFYNHMPASRVQHRVERKNWSEYFKFCIERNPWDLTLSNYHMLNYRAGKNIPFDEYLKRGKFRSNYYMYTNRTGELILNKVIKFENLIEELDIVFSNLGIPFAGTLGVNAKSEYRKERSPYQDVYSDQQRKIIERAFSREIKMHNYSF